MKIIKRGKNLNTAVEIMKKGKVVVCPTDTVYGLITDATNKKAIKKLFKIKRRKTSKPIPLFVKDLKAAKKIAQINKSEEQFLKKVWPGKITVVLKRKKIKKKLYGVDKRTIALRIPKYRLVNNLLRKISSPLTGTSANVSGKPATTKIKEVIEQFKNKKFQPDLIANAGNLKFSKPSMVIDLTKGFKILRK
jgi:L-threonylcarbamoyladenylate synthase